jgi:hypothetical protein
MLQRIKLLPSNETPINVDCIGILVTGYGRLVSRSETKKRILYNCNMCVSEKERKVLMAKNHWKLEGRLQTVKCHFCIMRHEHCYCSILNNVENQQMLVLSTMPSKYGLSYVAPHMLEWLDLWFKSRAGSWRALLRWTYLKIRHKCLILLFFQFTRKLPSIHAT